MGGETKNGVALFVPQFAFTGESSSLQRWQFLLTENIRFCAFLPQNLSQLMKTAPRVTLSRVGIKLRPLTVIYPPRRNLQEPNQCFICQHYWWSRRRRLTWNEVPSLAAGEILPPFCVSGALWRGFAAEPGGWRDGGRKGRVGAISTCKVMLLSPSCKNLPKCVKKNHHRFP